MKRPFFLIFTNAMICIVIFCLLAQSLVLVQRIAIADRIVGKVEVQRSGKGEWIALSQRAPIKMGDVVQTGADGQAEFVWADGTRWKMTPGTHLTVKKAIYNAVQKGDNSELDLTAGKVFVRIMKKLTPSSTFHIQTPTAVAAVRGTIFSVEVKDGKTQVAVWKGSVQVSGREDKAKTSTIEPGQVAMASGGAVQTSPSGGADQAFKRETSIVQPRLSFEVEQTEAGRGLLRGETEAGDVVTVNGELVRTLGNGTFLKRVKLQPGANTFVVMSLDKHGAKTTATRTLADADATSAPAH